MTLRKLEGGRLSTDAAGDLAQNFRSLFRSLVSIATGLYRSRELKDLFIGESRAERRPQAARAVTIRRSAGKLCDDLLYRR